MFTFRYILRRDVHSSILIGWLSVGIITGIAASALPAIDFGGGSWAVLALILISTSFFYRKAWVIVAILIGGVLLGLWRGSLEQSHLREYEQYIGQTVFVEGVIGEDPSVGKGNSTRIQLSRIVINRQSLSGAMWISTQNKQPLKRGDIVKVRGILKEGFGAYAAAMTYAEITDHAAGHDHAREARDWFGDTIKRVIPEPESSLGIGFLTGQRSSLPADFDEQLRVVGLTHIVVASGYNLTVLVRLCRRTFAKISKYLTALSGGVLIAGFILITGLSPSMSRAGLVAGLSLAAWYYGRNLNPFVLLPFVAAVSVLVNPYYIWGDIGWYLSFVAFAGVMIVAPLLQDYFFGKSKPGLIRQILGETVAALVVTAPIIAFTFGQYSQYALIANILIVPLIPLTMLFVFLAGVIAIIAPAVGFIAALPATALLSYMVAIVRHIASWPNSLIDISLSFLGLVVFYLVLAITLIYMWYQTRHDFRNDNLVE